MFQIMSSEEIKLDEKHLNNMKRIIIERIKQNTNTKEKTHAEMIDDIREVIILEANKNY